MNYTSVISDLNIMLKFLIQYSRDPRFKINIQFFSPFSLLDFGEFLPFIK